MRPLLQKPRAHTRQQLDRKLSAQQQSNMQHQTEKMPSSASTCSLFWPSAQAYLKEALRLCVPASAASTTRA
eukprot:1158084-Pelagomonas_calceolata.AAC.5